MPRGLSKTRRTGSTACGAAVLLLAFVASAGTAQAGDADDLVSRINAFRAAPVGRCASERAVPAGPLAPSAALAQVGDVTTAGGLDQALRATGYRAAVAATIVISGPSQVADVARVVEQSYCANVLDPRFAEIGVARSGTTWRVNLARPLLPNDLPEWREAGRAVLALVNEARRQPRRCGTRRFAAAGPLAWNDTLAESSLAHSTDMARRGYFDHADPAGNRVAERATRLGYRWRVIGENIAAGMGSSEQVVAGWLASPGHCANIMAPEFAEMGAGYATEAQSPMGIYWTQVFGKRS